MKKRIGAVLLILCLLAGLLPTMALAEGPGMDVSYDTFEEFQTAVEESTACLRVGLQLHMAYDT